MSRQPNCALGLSSARSGRRFFRLPSRLSSGSASARALARDVCVRPRSRFPWVRRTPLCLRPKRIA